MKAFTISLVLGLLVTFAATQISFCDGLNSNSNVLCIESERKALLKFKQDLIDESNRLSSWTEGDDQDCCANWIGVSCNNLTGHVTHLHLGIIPLDDEDVTKAERDAFQRSQLRGEINPALLHLKQLCFLDLSNNNFEGGHIPQFIGSLNSLTYLNLSGASFGGAIPHRQLGNLSQLQYLDLGYNFLSSSEAESSLRWVSNLSSLRYLDLSRADLSEATDWVQVTSSLPSLAELHLSECNLNNESFSVSTPRNVNYTSLAVLDLSKNMLYSIPTWIFSLPSLVSIDLNTIEVGGVIPNRFQNMSSLIYLDLSWNPFSSSSLPIWLSNLSKLQFLGLNGVGLQGNFSCTVGNLTSLTHLHLSKNQLEIIEPKCLESLCHLREIDLSNNTIVHDVSEIIGSLSRCRLDRLESLNLAFNRLSGHLIDEIGQFKNLACLKLYGNNISGPIPLSIGNLSSLKVFDVSNNSLTGSLPPSLGQLGNLKKLDVNNNKLEGTVLEMHFSNLTRLKIFRAFRNVLTFKPKPSWIPPFRCEIIQLGNWKLGPLFPQWLQFQKNLSIIDISDAGISGVIPNWFWRLSTEFSYVNVSINQLKGGIPYNLPVTDIADLSFNQFEGPLPRAFPYLRFLLISKNSFSGSLSNFLCNSSGYLQILDIDSNRLSGKIPSCWGNWGFLRILYLGNNNLSGKIPRSLGSLGNMVSLNLRNNSLVGGIPSSLKHLADMVILDLSENQLRGSIPTWIGHKLSKLVVLSLRSNNFHGPIPRQICALNSLQVLNLGHNNISGVIPKCFSKFSAMSSRPFHPYVGDLSHLFNYFSPLEAFVVMRGREDEYSTILGLVTSIDLSVNNLTGEIPGELGNLTWLRSLNLAGNLLTGKIPDSIGYMKLESLDLSKNQLRGEIPSSFSNMNFLNHLNLSYNDLRGRIPSGTQLQRFDNFSYMGNHLCGPPITKNCIGDGVTHNATNIGGSNNEGKKGFKVNWLYVSIVLGFVMGFWGVVAPLFFVRSWRNAYYQKLEHIGNRLYVFCAAMGK